MLPTYSVPILSCSIKDRGGFGAQTTVGGVCSRTSAQITYDSRRGFSASQPIIPLYGTPRIGTALSLSLSLSLSVLIFRAAASAVTSGSQCAVMICLGYPGTRFKAPSAAEPPARSYSFTSRYGVVSSGAFFFCIAVNSGDWLPHIDADACRSTFDGYRS